MDQHETWHAGRPRPWPHCVRWGPSSPPQRSRAPNFRPIFVVAKWLDGSRFHMVGRWPNGWMDQDNTWHGGGPRSRPHIVLDGDLAPTLQKRSRGPNFWPISVMAMQTAGSIKMPLGMEVGLVPGDIVLWGTSAAPKGGTSPNFSPMSIVAKRLYASGYHMVWLLSCLIEQEGQHPLTRQRAANFRLLANQ